MRIGRIIATAIFFALLGTPAAPADKIVPRAGHAIAPLPTDEAVRKGMATIRDLVRTNHSLVTHRRMPPDHALRFAAQVKVEADRILATSNLSGEAQEKLRALLEEIVKGVGAVAKPTEGGGRHGRAGPRRRSLGALPAGVRSPRLGAGAIARVAPLFAASLSSRAKRAQRARPGTQHKMCRRHGGGFATHYAGSRIAVRAAHRFRDDSGFGVRTCR
ncbi:MAG: hypothetical protein M5U16_15080 [Hyphomicrobium sp.]|nr:hypothetical protein [Hyphomicrobium sp.]